MAPGSVAPVEMFLVATTSMNLTVPLLVGLAKLISGATVRWVDCQPDTCQRVYFANHTSHLDALVLWASLPPDVRSLTRPVAAKDYWDRGPLRRHIAQSFNALLIDRKDIKVHNSPIQRILSEIGDTHSVIVFPEGGRNDDGQIGEFKSGIYYLNKKRPELEMVPVYLDNMNRILPRGEVLPVPLLSCITFGAPMWLEAGESKEGFLRRAREAVLRLKEL
jgi:1-acyl-sn-glycerol-3-phosphate acyltransferase